MPRHTGVVQWFSRAKGYGFIKEDGGSDLFVHHTGIQMAGFRALEGGDRVSFEIGAGPRGAQAEDVVREDARLWDAP